MTAESIDFNIRRILIFLATDFLFYTLLTSLWNFYKSNGYYGIGFAAFVGFIGIVRATYAFFFLALLTFFQQISFKKNEILAFTYSFLVVIVLGFLLSIDYSFGKNIGYLIVKTGLVKIITDNIPFLIAYIVALVFGNRRDNLKSKLVQ